FPGDDSRSPRPLHPATLPAHHGAFALTVRKSQGSELDEVWMVLPERISRVMSRELVYTGLTRARRKLHLFSNPREINHALSAESKRNSGLRFRLGNKGSS